MSQSLKSAHARQHFIPYSFKHLLLPNLRPRNDQRLFTRELRNISHDLRSTCLNRLLERADIVPIQ